MDKTRLISVLMERLFEPEQRRLKAVIQDLNRRNKQLRQSFEDGFIYGGLPYALTTRNINRTIPSLDFSLNAEMDAWLSDQKIVQTDRTIIRQMLFTLLRPCETERDVRNAIPECLVSMVQGLSAYSREHNPGYTLRGDLRAMRQFTKLTLKMQAYSTGSLFY